MDFLEDLQELALKEGVIEKEGYSPKYYSPRKFKKKFSPSQALKSRLKNRKNRFKIKQYNKDYRRKHKLQLKRRNKLRRLRQKSKKGASS